MHVCTLIPRVRSISLDRVNKVSSYQVRIQGTGVQMGGGALGAVGPPPPPPPPMKFKHGILLVFLVNYKFFSFGYGFLWGFSGKNVLEIALSKR